MKAMIFAAGIGSRLRPITDKIPKALVPINGIPLLELQIKHLQKYNIYDLVINVHHFSSQIIDFLSSNKNFGSNIVISNETDKLLDTGGGLLKAIDFFEPDESFLVQNVDVFSDIDYNNLIEYNLNSKALVTLAVSDRKSSRYFYVDEKGFITGWINTKSNEEKRIGIKTQNEKIMAFSGIHVIKKSFFDYINFSGVFSIIDAYLQSNMNGKIISFEHDSSNWLDVGKPETLKEAQKLIERINY